jgi:segregation and condensation protein B
MNLVAALEAILFVSDGPVALSDLCYACETKEKETEGALSELAKRLQETSGLQLVRIAGGYQICTKNEYAEAIARFLKPQKQRLSRSALEVLAIVAYRQPLTSSEIDIVRGVQSDHAIRSLVDKNLIAEIDRKQTPGRPILYGTTQHFLHQFKLDSLEELPPLQGEPQLEEVGA